MPQPQHPQRQTIGNNAPAQNTRSFTPGFPGGGQGGFPGGSTGFPGGFPGGPGQGGFPPPPPGTGGFPGGGGGGFPGGAPGGFPGGQQNPPGAPQSPPPSFIPQQQSATLFAIDPGSIRRCLGRYVYIWQDNGDSYWIFLTHVGRNSIAGFRWYGFGPVGFWLYFGLDLRRIQQFFCS